MALNRPEPPNMARVSDLLAMDRTTLTANLKPLERRGLVNVSVDAADRRCRRLDLTPAGRALLVRALPIWRRAHRAIERGLAGAEPDRLRADLRAVSKQAV
jgi:DNA-binding MarR family transcriptional regulator